MSVPTLDEAGPGLLKLLGDPAAAVRAEAAGAIGPLVARGVAPAGSLDALARGMSDPDAEVRESAGPVVGARGSTSRRRGPADHGPAGIRWWSRARRYAPPAAAGLARATVSDTWKKALRQALSDPEETVRTRALATVGHVARDPEMLAVVLRRTTPSTPKGVRLTAIGS